MERINLLDHGYMQYIDHCGSDEGIVEAARMSTDKGFRSWEPYVECTECGKWWLVGWQPLCEHPDQNWRKVPRGDMGLLSYLRANRHTTPFEMGTIIIECQAPIMVYREWHRHRTQSYNELSARYTPLPDVNYVPTVERLMLNSKTNKQAGVAKGAETLDETAAESYRKRLVEMYMAQEALYQYALNRGVPKELARVHLPVGRYSRMRASANLKNWLDFMTLRSDSTEQGKKAQWEIRQYANAVGTIIAELFPKTWQLFVEGGK
jgi:thymidylate synthase (FAD)